MKSHVAAAAFDVNDYIVAATTTQTSDAPGAANPQGAVRQVWYNPAAQKALRAFVESANGPADE